jgi:hypothetical protein
MHVVKQLSEDEFVIKMDDYDLDRQDSVRIAHDYVQFSGRTYMNVEAPKDWKPYGKFKSVASNIMGYYTDLQIPIRRFIKVILPFLNNSKYCQETHITNEDGTPRYNYESDIPLITISEGKTLVHIRQENGEYYSMPIDVYNSIKKQVKEECE